MTHKEIGPAKRICTHCREEIPEGLGVRRGAHDYHMGCAVVLGIVIGVERNPAKYGGHAYVGPRLEIEVRGGETATIEVRKASK